MKNVRILLADDLEIVRNGVRQVLESEPGWVVCGQATSGVDAVELAVELTPDVIVLAVQLPNMSGLQAAREIRSHISTPIVFITALDSADFERAAMESGEHGLPSTSGAGIRLIEAVRAVLPQETMSKDSEAGPGSNEPRPLRSGSPELTRAERDVLRLLASGLTTQQIAARLDITSRTAARHRARIKSKLKIDSTDELVRYAIRNRIIQV